MFDGLVTCSTRLDVGFRGSESRHSVGPNNHSLSLVTDVDRQGTRIYLDKESVQAVLDISKDPNAFRCVVGGMHHQPPQLRSAFHHPGAYTAFVARRVH
ncbi:hypothetical protein B0O80DRAFT_509984 [Mortierella sp. GBAus27b]|nr:hypothetical protein B0O80DRAFT_509984 [Mortierella sp. GBAus27b]